MDDALHLRLDDINAVQVEERHDCGFLIQKRLRVLILRDAGICISHRDGLLHRRVELIVLPVRVVEVRGRGEELVVPVGRVAPVGAPEAEEHVERLVRPGIEPVLECLVLKRVELDVDAQ